MVDIFIKNIHHIIYFVFLSVLLIVNIPMITRTMLLAIHKGGIGTSLFANCSPFKIAIKAKKAKAATANNPDNH